MDSREGSQDRSESRMVRHQHSFSESGRASVPMWDSSDPDRAPPPLPLNPGASNSPITKANVSSNIEKAAALIASRAADNTPSAYTINPPPSASPERLRLQHRRMQSIQTGSVGRLSDSLERRSPDKGLSRSKLSDYDDFRMSRSLERSPVRLGSEVRTNSETPTPPGKLKVTEKAGDDENTSPKMLALQSMRNRQESENPLADITNNASVGRSNMSLDSLSNQILNITSIATNLQREMTNLSKRSKDNATDLFSLREATNSRDEDIRKSLRDLLASLDNKFTSIDSKMIGSSNATRSTPNLGLYLDEKAHDTPIRKTLHLPRVAGPPSFLEHEITVSPSVVSVDGAASIALLEKVLREMATKDGQEKIMGTLESVKTYAQAKSSQAVVTTSQAAIDPEMMKKLEEILVFMKDMRDDSGSKALIKVTPRELHRSPSQIDLYLDKTGQVARARQDEDQQSTGTGTSPPGSEFLNEELVKALKGVKQSLSQNGGLTNEVKTLVRELRGEVLGMGREIARKLEEADAVDNMGRSVVQGAANEDVSRIVEQGLAELKEQLHHIVHESQRQTETSTRSVVDTDVIITAVQKLVSEMPRPREEPSRNPAVEREEMLIAVREAWEDCKPEIALEHFGLERDEILETLKEGLQSYQPPQQTSNDHAGVTYDQVLEAVQRGLEGYRPPQIEIDTGATKDEVLAAIRDCLDNHNFPNFTAPSQLTTSTELSRDEIVDAVKEVLSMQVSQPRELDFTKEDILEAVRDGYSAHSHVTKEVEFNRGDLFDAIKACLEGEQNPLGGMGARVVEAMHEFLGSMKDEFQQYSAANGRDTEQVLDALKDGLEELRAEIESYVDRASDVTGKDEIVDTVKAGFAAMQADMDKGFSARTQSALNTPELLDAMEKEFEHLRDTISKSISRTSADSGRDEILDAIRDITDDRQSSVSSNGEDLARLVKEELEHMRTTLAATLIRTGGSLERDDVLDVIREGLENHRSVPRATDGNESILSNTSELLDAFQEGVDGLRSDMQKLVEKSSDMSTSYEILDTLRAGIDNVRADIERLNEKQGNMSDDSTARGGEMMLHEGNNISSEIESLKVMITQLRIKVESLDNMPIPEPVIPTEMRMHKDDLDDIHFAIRELHDSVNGIPRELAVPEVSMPAGTASKEDTDAIETLLRNVKAQVDSLAFPDMEDAAKTTHLISIEDVLRDIKASVELAGTKSAESNNKEDFTLVQLMLKDVQTSIEKIQPAVPNSSNEEDKLSKTDLHVLESICLETREKLDSFSLPDIENLANREDILEMRDSIVAFREQFEADNDLTAQAFEARKIEHGGLAAKIDDVKTIVGEVREELMSKLNGSEEGIVELAKVLGMHHDNMNTYATASSLAELHELMSGGLGSHMDHLAASKTEMEERDATLFGRHEETSAELKAKIDEKFTELMTKYDDAQISNESKLNAFDDRDKTHLEAATGVKLIVEELKSLMDTLGATVSETCDKLSTDSRTVFEKVDDANTKLADLHVLNAQEHGLTREEVFKAVAITTRLEGSLQQHQPAILTAIQEVLGIVGQHYEHSQQQGEKLKAATDEIKSGVSAIPSAIPPLLPAPDSYQAPPSVVDFSPQKEYDDTEVHIKLDELLSHTNTTRKALQTIDNHNSATQEALAGLHRLEGLEKLEQLDAIHDSVRTTADEITAMVATQTRLMAEHHESKADEAREAAIALEKRTAQKEKIEAEILALALEKNALANSMAALRREHEELVSDTKRLSREVGKLETALSIRQEEMRDMDARAESLERRVLEGVMNHARSIKLAKPISKKKVSPVDRDASMNLKRIPSTASNATAKVPSVRNGSSTFGNAVGMALKKRNPLGATGNPATSSRASGVDRRILSTSHVTSSRASDAHRALVLAPSTNAGLISLKRSHSVKSNPSSYLSGRKPSWNGPESITDKENHVDHESQEEQHDSADDLSDAGTERRTSYTGTYTDSMVYGTGSSLSRDSMRSTSYASSIGGPHHGHTESIVEEDEDVDEAEEAEEDLTDDEQFEEAVDGDSQALMLAEPLHFDNSNQAENTHVAFIESLEAEDELGDLPGAQRYGPKYALPSDSGIGSEPPTPDVSHQGSHGWRSNISS